MNETLLAERFTPQLSRSIESTRQVGAARFSPCGRFLCAAGYDGLVHRWDLSGEEPVASAPLAGHNGWVSEIAFAAAGEVVYSADSWGQLRAAVYSEPEQQPLWTVAEAHDGWIHGLAVATDGTKLATGGNDRAVRIWSTEGGRLLQTCLGHGDDVLDVGFHPDGRHVVSGDLQGVVKQWDAASGTHVRDFDAELLHTSHRLQDVGGVRRLAFNPDGSLLAVAGTKPKNGGNVQGVPTVLLFDWASGQLQQTLEFGKTSDVYICDLQFHPAGFLMAVTSGNPGTGKLVFRVPEEEQPFCETTKMANCHSLSLHPAGDRLAVAATNARSNGNGRRLNKEGEYVGNHSPINIFEFPEAAQGREPQAKRDR